MSAAQQAGRGVSAAQQAGRDANAARGTTDGVHAARTAPRAVIVACPDGPLLVRGQVELRTPDGEPVPRRRATVALCRCGGTGIPPYCDGTHKVIGYRTPR